MSVHKFAFHGLQHKIAFHQFTRCCTVALRNGTAQAHCKQVNTLYTAKVSNRGTAGVLELTRCLFINVPLLQNRVQHCPLSQEWANVLETSYFLLSKSRFGFCVFKKQTYCSYQYQSHRRLHCPESFFFLQNNQTILQIIFCVLAQLFLAFFLDLQSLNKR